MAEMMSKKSYALSFLYRELRAAKIALGHAESKPNVSREELDNLQNRIDAIDWMIPIVMKEDGHDNTSPYRNRSFQGRYQHWCGGVS